MQTRALGLRGVMCALDNAAEALAAEGIEVLSTSTLGELCRCLVEREASK